jgi:hypothetical protein
MLPMHMANSSKLVVADELRWQARFLDKCPQRPIDHRRGASDEPDHIVVAARHRLRRYIADHTMRQSNPAKIRV